MWASAQRCAPATLHVLCPSAEHVEGTLLHAHVCLLISTRTSSMSADQDLVEMHHRLRSCLTMGWSRSVVHHLERLMQLPSCHALTRAQTQRDKPTLANPAD